MAAFFHFEGRRVSFVDEAARGPGGPAGARAAAGEGQCPHAARALPPQLQGGSAAFA